MEKQKQNKQTKNMLEMDTGEGEAHWKQNCNTFFLATLWHAGS